MRSSTDILCFPWVGMGDEDSGDTREPGSSNWLLSAKTTDFHEASVEVALIALS